MAAHKLVLEIVTHAELHFDEALAIWILRKFGSAFFTGVEKAPLRFWPAGARSFGGKPAADWEKQGCLIIGVGGGEFDEHPSPGKPRKEGECAATLVAAAIGVREKRELQALFKVVLTEDLEGGARMTDLASIMKTMFAVGVREDRVLALVFEVLDALYLDQLDFFKAVDELERTQVVQEVRRDGRGSIAVATVCSDLRQAPKAARSEFGSKAGVVIARKTNRRTQIFVNKGSGVDVIALAIALRMAERQLKRAAGQTLAGVTEEELSGEGSVDGAREWHVMPLKEKKRRDDGKPPRIIGGMLLNGSNTNSVAPPTGLSLNQIYMLVEGVIARYFETLDDLHDFVLEVCSTSC